MASPLPAVRQTQLESILSDLAAGNGCAIYGLSNTGKRPLLRALASPESHARYAELAGAPGALVYVDCNRVVQLSATGFHEVVLRSLLERSEERRVGKEGR